MIAYKVIGLLMSSLLGLNAAYCPFDVNPAPYQAVIAWSAVPYLTNGATLNVVFCILGDRSATRGKTIAAYKIIKGDKAKRIFLDRNRGFNPWKIRVCQLDGDPEPEVAVGVYKSTRFYPQPDNRLFIYDWNGKSMYPKWLGSRLALPFVDFAFTKSGEGVHNLVALEKAGSEKYLIRLYHWNGFGFTPQEETLRPRSIDEGREILNAVEKGESLEDAGRRVVR